MWLAFLFYFSFENVSIHSIQRNVQCFHRFVSFGFKGQRIMNIMKYTLNPIWTLNTHIPNGTSCRLLMNTITITAIAIVIELFYTWLNEKGTQIHHQMNKKKKQNNWKEMKWNGHCMEVCHIWIRSIRMYRHERPWMWLIGYESHAYTFTLHTHTTFQSKP